MFKPRTIAVTQHEIELVLLNMSNTYNRDKGRMELFTLKSLVGAGVEDDSVIREAIKAS